jgi:hypothetical protein
MSKMMAVSSLVTFEPASRPSASRMAGVDSAHVRYRPHSETTPSCPPTVTYALSMAGCPGGISRILIVSPDARPV